MIAALDADKHVFVEKPLCLTACELTLVQAAYARAQERAQKRPLAATEGRAPCLMVGFNRRFAPHVERLRSLLQGAPGPKAVTMTVNAGAIPASHWTQDRASGGGRIVGEGCHFIDLIRFLVGHEITSHARATMTAASDDTATLQLGFADGSIGTVHYFANGPKALPKERLEVFAQGRVLQLDNFRSLRGFGWPGFSSKRLWRQDKGQRACAAAFLAAVSGAGASPIPFAEIVEVSGVSISLAEAP